MKSILVSNLKNLGDVICGTACLELVRRTRPDLRVGLMIRPAAVEIMRNSPLVDDLFVYDYKSGSGAGSVIRMAREIRPKKYDAFVTLDRKPRSLAVALLAGIKQRYAPVVDKKGDRDFRHVPYLANRLVHYPQGLRRCLVEFFSDPVLKALGIEEQGEGQGRITLPPLSDGNRKKAETLLAPAGNRPRVGFSVCADYPGKHWAPDRFAQLMDRLARSHNPFLYVTGAPGDREYIDRLSALCETAKPVNYAGQTGILDTVAVMARSDLFVTLDTGSVHMAANSGLENVICIFTCTRPVGVQRSAPRAKMFWTGEPCCPCSGVCPKGYDTAPCRVGIGVDEVYRAAIEMLDRSK